jgi:hypothetical protein
MRSHAGFSGSPVFLLIPQQSFRREIGDTSLEVHVTRFRLLGIDTGHMVDRLAVEQMDPVGQWATSGHLRVSHFSDVSIVAPIWNVVDLLKQQDLATERENLGRQLEAERRREAAVAEPTSSAG